MKKAVIDFKDHTYIADLSKPIDLSIPLISEKTTPNAWFAPLFRVEPVVSGDWIGDTLQGSPVNFKNVSINPHGNGTHTECVGHISKEPVTIHQTLKTFWFVSQLVSAYPQKQDNGDRVIGLELLDDIIPGIEAVIIRSLPNGKDKMDRSYSGNNPPFFDSRLIKSLRAMGVKHLLTDLPSVDKEEDGGALAAHKAFWDYPNSIDKERTISELIFVNNSIPDNIYLLNIQIISLEMDASPSKPVLYALSEQ